MCGCVYVGEYVCVYIYMCVYVCVGVGVVGVEGSKGRGHPRVCMCIYVCMCMWVCVGVYGGGRGARGGVIQELILMIKKCKVGGS